MHRFFLSLSRAMAWAGGAMLALLIGLTCLSVLGRASGVGPITGDYELVEAGIAFCIFAFLPLCQITGGHASVDVFTNRWTPRANRLRQMLTDLVFAAVLILIAVQLGAGMVSKLRSGQTTFLIEFPLWWAYALSLTGATVAALVAAYVAAVRLGEIWTARAILPDDAG